MFQDSLNSPSQQNGTKTTNGTIPTVINGGTTNGNSVTTNGQTNGQINGVTLKLIIPASQCGSLIGKAGAKIKEIREVGFLNFLCSFT